MAIITTSGFPSDQLGNSGDYAIDPVAHFIYGPKTSTWGGTASSLQGPSGPGMVYGNGAPTTNQGAIGQGYLDLSSGNFYGPKNSQGAWGNAVYKLQGAAGVSVLSGAGSPTSNNVTGVSGQTYIDTNVLVLYVYNNGAWNGGTSLVGPAGATLLTGTGAGVGPYGTIVSTTLSAAPTPFLIAGTTMAAIFTPLAPSAFLGCYAYSSAAATLQLYNLTTSTVVYSTSLSAGTNLVTSYFPVTSYPLTANNSYQWQLTGSASTNAQVEPFYLMPANNPGLSIGLCGPAGFSTSQAFTSTATNVPIFGTAAGATLYTHVPVRTGGVYSAVATYVPASGTPTTASVTPKLYYANVSSGSGGAVGFTFSACTANSTPQTLLTPQLSDLTSLATGNYFYWKVTGSGSGTFVINLYALI